MSRAEGARAEPEGVRRFSWGSVSEAVASRADDDGVRFDRLGQVAFKGVAEDIVVHRALRN